MVNATKGSKEPYLQHPVRTQHRGQRDTPFSTMEGFMFLYRNLCGNSFQIMQLHQRSKGTERRAMLGISRLLIPPPLTQGSHRHPASLLTPECGTKKPHSAAKNNCSGQPSPLPPSPRAALCPPQRGEALRRPGAEQTSKLCTDVNMSTWKGNHGTLSK